ncbi:MAG: HEAT repeat domain-containing protein [Candidatus Wallbacteria bacterium]
MKKIILLIILFLIVQHPAYSAPSIPIEKVPADTPYNVLCQIERLYSPWQIERLRAVDKLEKIGPQAQAAFPFLKTMFWQEDRSIVIDNEIIPPKIIRAMFKIDKEAAAETLRQTISIDGSKEILIYDKNNTVELGVLCIRRDCELRKIAIDELFKMNNAGLTELLIKNLAIEDDISIVIQTVDILAKILDNEKLKKFSGFITNETLFRSTNIKNIVKYNILPYIINVLVEENINKSQLFIFGLTDPLCDSRMRYPMNEIIKMLDGRNPIDKMLALEKFIEFDDSAAVILLRQAALNSNESLRLFAFHNLKSYDKSCDDIYRKALSDPSSAVRFEAVKFIEKFDASEKISAYEKFLASQIDADKKLYVINELKKIKTPDAKRLLISAFKNENNGSITTAFWESIGAFDDSEAVLLLSNELDKGWMASCDEKLIFKILAGMKTSEAWEVLKKKLALEHNSLRQNCINALGDARCENAFDELMKNCDKHKFISQELAAAIRKINFKKKNKCAGRFLNSADRKIKLEGLKAIIENGETLPVEFVLEAVKNNDNFIYYDFEINCFQPLCVAALAKLIKKDDTVSIALLCESLKSIDPLLRKTSALALYEIGWQPSNDSEMAYYYMASENFFVCSRLPESAKNIIKNELKNADSKIKLSAMKAVSKFDDQNSGGLMINLIGDNDENVAVAACRHAAAKDIIQNSSKLLDALKKFKILSSKNEVIDLLINSGNPDILRKLIHVMDTDLKNIDHSPRKAKISKLIASDEKYTELLMRHSVSKDDFEIYHLIKEMPKLKNDMLRDFVLKNLRNTSSEPNVRKEAALLLKRSDTSINNDIDRMYYAFALEDYETIQNKSSIYDDIIISEFNNASPPLKNMLIDYMSKLKTKKIVDFLTANINNSKNINIETKRKFVKALGDISDTNSVELLIKCLDVSGLEEAAASALGSSKDARVLKILVSKSKDKTFKAEIALIKSLAMFDDTDAVEAIGDIMFNDNDFIFNSALGALAKYDLARTKKKVDEVLSKKNWRECSIIAKTFKCKNYMPAGDKTKVNYYLPLLCEGEYYRRYLNSPIGQYNPDELKNTYVSKYAADELINLENECIKEFSAVKDDEALKILAGVLTETEIKKPDPLKMYILRYDEKQLEFMKLVIIKAVSKSKSKIIHDALKQVLKDPDSIVRCAAEEALKHISDDTIPDWNLVKKEADEAKKRELFNYMKNTKLDYEVEETLEKLKKLDWMPASDYEKTICLLLKNDMSGLKKMGRPAFDCLINESNKPDSNLRERSLNAAAKIYNSDAGDIMLQFFQGSEPGLKIIAARYLARSGGQKYAKMIAYSALSDQKTGESLMNILAETRPENIENYIVPFIFTGDYGFGNRAVLALEKLGWRPKNEVEKAYYYMYSSNFKKAAENYDDISRILKLEEKDQFSLCRGYAGNFLVRMRDLKNADQNLKVDAVPDYARERISKILSSVSDTGVIYLIDQISLNDGAEAGQYPEDICSVIKSTDQVEILNGLLNNDYWRIRKYAAEALGMIAGKAACQGLINSLNDLNEEVIANAGLALARMDCRSAEAEILKKLKQSVKYKGDLIFAKLGEALLKLNKAKAVDFLIECLNDRKENIRYCAERLLGTIDDPRVIAALGEKIFSNDLNERKISIRSLARINNKNALPYILKALKKYNLEIKNEAVELLKLWNSETEAIEILRPLINEWPYDKRLITIDLLEKLNWRPQNNIEKIYYFTAKKDYNAVSKIDAETASEVLIHELGKYHYADAVIALEKINSLKAREYLFEFIFSNGYFQYSDVFIAKINEAEIKKIIELANSEKKIGKKRKIIEIISKLSNPDVLKFLMENISNNDDSIRYNVACGLQNYNEPEVIDALKKLTEKDFELSVRCAAAASLFKIAGPASLDTAGKLLKSNIAELISMSISAVEKFNGFKYIPELTNLLSDSSDKIRKLAVEALQSLKWIPKTDYDKAFYYFAANCTSEINTLSDSSVKMLIDELHKKNSLIKYDVLNYLSYSNNSLVIECLIGLLNNDDTELQITAVDILGRRKEKKALSFLSGILNDKATQNNGPKYNTPNELKAGLIMNTESGPDFFYLIGTQKRLKAVAAEAYFQINNCR